MYVINIRPRVLSVYNWEATHLHDFNLDQLGIDEDEYLWAICAMGEDRIVLATGPYDSIHSFHTYDME